LFLFVFVLVQCAHWIGFLLDEVLFRGYRDVEIREPLFVVGMPRTGTSFLQQVLSEDAERFTTLRLWELALAPSVTERTIALGLIRVDRLLGRPIGRVLERVEAAAFRWINAVHPVALDNPEEDYFFLLPIFACFLLVVPFPDHPRVWEVSRFDDLPRRDREAILGFFRSCAQRHLYVVGRGRQLLSKNPSFTPMLRSLVECFPDARILCCVRDPLEAVGSLLNSMQPGAEFFGWDMRNPVRTERFVGMLEYSARHAIETLGGLEPDRYAFVPLPALRRDAGRTVTGVYRRFGWVPGEGFLRALSASTASGRKHRSRHEYALSDFGLTPDAVRSRFPQLLDLLASERESGQDRRSAGVRS
jgi:hypothetical protein